MNKCRLFDDCSPSAATAQMDVETLPSGNRPDGVFIVGRFSHGVYTVGEDVSRIVAFSKEREVDRQVTWCPVGHGGQIPGGSLPSGDDGIFAHQSVKGDGLVEGGGNLSDEIGTLLILHVLRGLSASICSGASKVVYIAIW